jgi:hypothetical protein
VRTVITSQPARLKMRWRTALLVAVAIALLCWAAPAAQATDVRQIELSPSGTDPALAYNPRNDEFLVTWAGRVSDDERAVTGVRLDGRGRPLGRAFTIATVAIHPASLAIAPAVAYDSRAHRYVVVWSAGPDVRARLIGPRGARLDQERIIAQPFTSFPSATPVVAYNPVADRYLVVWQLFTPTGTIVRMQQLDGALQSVSFGQQVPASGCAFDVASSDTEARWLLTLAALCAGRDRPGRISGVVVGPEGARPVTVSRPGLGRPYRAGVAFNSQRQEFLATWWAQAMTGCQDCHSVSGIYGQRLAPDGASVGPDDFAISPWELAMGTEPLGATTDVAYDPRSEGYLVVWDGVVGDWPNGGALEILAQALTGDGQERGPEDIQVSTMDLLAAHAGKPVIAARTRRGGGLLVAWQRQTTPLDTIGSGIFARWLAPRDVNRSRPQGHDRGDPEGSDGSGNAPEPDLEAPAAAPR